MVPILCKNWGCAQCGPMKAAWLKRQVGAAVASGQLVSFWTLTIRTSTCTPWESFELVARAWDRLSKRVKRQYGPFEYVWTREATKRGFAHLHVCASVSIDQAWLSSAWLECTGGSWIVDVQPIESEKVANYLAKYVVSQACSRPRGPGGEASKLNVYGHSKGVVFEPFTRAPEGSHVIVADLPYRDALALLPRDGRQVVKLKGAPSIEFEDWGSSETMAHIRRQVEGVQPRRE
jgi:hypothetical protein